MKGLFLVDELDTWCHAATFDIELKKMLDDGVTPVFTGEESKDFTLAQQRVKFNSIFEAQHKKIVEAAKNIKVQEILIPVADDAEKVRALVYTSVVSVTNDAESTKKKTRKPLVVLIHGGGFVLGNAEMETAPCIGAVQQYDCVAISLEHRLSPEVKFPVPWEDCWDALLWILSNASALDADPTLGFVLGGTSAGSHLTIPLAHKIRDSNHPMFNANPITGLVHIVPPTLPIQASRSPAATKYLPLYNSRSQLANGLALTAESTKFYDQAVEPNFMSPLWAPLLWPTGHKGLPRTFFQICGADLLRDEALIYERELRLECGVETKTIVYEGLPHVFWYDYPGHSKSKRFVEDTVKGLGWLLKR